MVYQVKRNISKNEVPCDIVLPLLVYSNSKSNSTAKMIDIYLNKGSKNKFCTEVDLNVTSLCFFECFKSYFLFCILSVLITCNR